MIVNDLVILGRGAPDRMRDGRITVCTAGYSPSKGFVRVYPTRLDSPCRMWNIVEVPLEKNPQDTRTESWKIEGSKDEWVNLGDKIKVIGLVERQERLDLITNLVDGCIKDINSKKRSLGIIKPNIINRYFSKRISHDPSIQLRLDGRELPKTKKQYPKVPRFTYRCSDCKCSKHDQQLLEWGAYEWIRKNPEKREQIWENLLLDSPKHMIFFFVGNQAFHRKSFVVITVLRLPKHE